MSSLIGFTFSLLERDRLHNYGSGWHVYGSIGLHTLIEFLAGVVYRLLIYLRTVVKWRFEREISHADRLPQPSTDGCYDDMMWVEDRAESMEIQVLTI